MNNEELDIVEVDNPEEFINLLKDQGSTIMSHTYNILDQITLDNNEKQPEELDVINRMLMLELLDEIKRIKHELFENVLDSYNDLIREMNVLRIQFSQENKDSIEMKEYIERSMKRTMIISAGISIIFPGLIPLVLIYDIPKLGFDTMIKKYHENRLDDNNMSEELFETVQKPLYELMDILRTDYHHSLNIFNELEEKALNGENIINELKELINPERVGLELIEEKQKVYTKEK